MTPPVSSTNAEVLARIETKLDALSISVTDIARIQAVQEHRITQTEKQGCKNEDSIESLAKTVERLETTVKIMAAVAGVAGSAIGLWLIGQLLGLVA